MLRDEPLNEKNSSFELTIYRVALIFLLAVSIYFYYEYHSHFSYEVIHLENRSGVHLVNNTPTIRAFFITNRESETGSEDKFKDINAKKLTYGITYIEIPKQYRIGDHFDVSKLHLQKYNEKNFISQ